MQIRSHYVGARDLKNFFDCAGRIQSNANTKKQIKWFIVSDIKSMLSTISKARPDKTIFQTNGTARHRNGHNASVNDEATIKAVLDIELLSLCDEIIQTSGSTFGFISVIKAQKMPYYVNGTKGCGKRCANMTGCEKMTLGRPHVRQDYFAAVYKRK